MQWNPHAPDVIGAEFPPRSDVTLPSYRIDAPVKAAAMRLDSTVTETVSTLGIFANTDTAAGRILAEVLMAGSEVPVAPTTTTFRPNVLGGTAPSFGSVASINQPTYNLANYITVAGGAAATFLLEFDTAGALTGERILDVRLVVVFRDNLRSGTDIIFEFRIDTGGVDGVVWFGPVRQPNNTGDGFGSGPPYTAVISTGEVYPDAQQPWTLAQLQAFDAGVVRVQLASTAGSGSHSPEYFQVYMEVDHVPENRYSTQVITTAATGARWVTATPRTPTAGSNIAKVNGTDLTLLIRQPRYGDIKPSTVPADYLFSVPYIRGCDATPQPGLIQYDRIALNLDGTVSELGTPTGDRLIGFEMQVAGTQSVDAQPYSAVPAVLVSGTVQQEVSQAAAGSYAGVIIPARYTPVGGVAGNLVVTLKRRTDNVTMGTATITQALADTFTADEIAGWRLITAPFAANATLAVGIQYYLDLTEAGTGTWEVPALSGVPVLGSPVTGVASYRGTTDVATYGGGDVNAADLPIVVYALVSPPAGLAVADQSTATPDSGPYCAVTAIGYNRVTWTAVVLATFSHYEIQRNDAFTDWQTVALITTSTVTAFEDYEARIGYQSCYRIRTVATTGISSAWSSTVCDTVAAYGCGLTLTANSWPEGSVAYGDVFDGSGGFVDKEYRFPEVDEVQERTFHGRDGKVAFIPAERRWSEFDRRLMVASIVATGPAPMQADPIRDLSRATLPYVCVRDEDGGRWFANVQVGSLTDRRPGRFEYVDIHVNELTLVAYPIDVAP